MTQQDIARQQRHAHFEAIAKKNCSLIGFVAILALMFQAYEDETAPTGIFLLRNRGCVPDRLSGASSPLSP